MVHPLGTAAHSNREQLQALAGTQLAGEAGRNMPRALSTRRGSRPPRVAAKATDGQPPATTNRAWKPLTPAQLAGQNARFEARLAGRGAQVTDHYLVDPDKGKRLARFHQ